MSDAWNGARGSVRRTTEPGAAGEVGEREPHERGQGTELRAAALARRVGAIADPALRASYLGHTFERMDAGEVADLLTLTVHRAETRDPAQSDLLLATWVALAQSKAENLRRAIVREALARGQLGTAAMLDEPMTEDADDAALPDHGRGRPLTLGERKSLARRRDRDLMARIARDPSPEVIRILLGNPALTEADVIRLCARRPVPAEVLREVFRAPRWAVRYRVRLAIVRNPHTPLDLALQLAALVKAPDAREIASSPELSPALRDACRRVAGVGTLH